MFPTQQVTIENLNNNNKKISMDGKSFLFDFNTGDFVKKDGKIVKTNKIEALKVWIVKVLKTDRNKFPIYDGTDYGIISLKELITSDYPLGFIKSEIERVIKETLLKNSAINSIKNVQFERNKRSLTVTFDCYTIYGAVKSEVII